MNPFSSCSAWRKPFQSLSWFVGHVLLEFFTCWPGSYFHLLPLLPSSLWKVFFFTSRHFLSGSWDAVSLAFTGSRIDSVLLGVVPRCWVNESFHLGWARFSQGLWLTWERRSPSASSILLRRGFQGALVSAHLVKRALPSIGSQISVARTPEGEMVVWVFSSSSFMLLWLLRTSMVGPNLSTSPSQLTPGSFLPLPTCAIPTHVVTYIQKIISYRLQSEAGISKGGILLPEFQVIFPGIFCAGGLFRHPWNHRSLSRRYIKSGTWALPCTNLSSNLCSAVS